MLNISFVASFMSLLLYCLGFEALKLSVKSKVELGFDALLAHCLFSVPYLQLECGSLHGRMESMLMCISRR